METRVALHPFTREFLLRLVGVAVLLLGMLAIAAMPALGQTVYYQGPQPIVVYPPQTTVVGQGPIIVQVVDPPVLPPAVTVQVVSPPVSSATTAPPAVVQAAVATPSAVSVAVSGGISNVCVSCSNVTQTVNVTKRVRTRPAIVSKALEPKPSAPPSGTPPVAGVGGRDDWWLIPLLLALLGGLLLALLGWLLGSRVYPAPPAAATTVSPSAGPPVTDSGIVTIPIVMRVEAEPIVVGLNPAVRRPRALARPDPAPAPAPAVPPRVRVGSRVRQ